MNHKQMTSLLKLERQKVNEIEARIREMDNLPASLDLLAAALEMIITVTSSELKISRREGPAGQILEVRAGRHLYNITVDDDKYIDSHMYQADTFEQSHSSVERLAWEITGHYVAPRHIFAAIERCRSEGRNLTTIPVVYLYEEMRKDESNSLPKKTH